MREEVFYTHEYKFGIKIDRQFLMSLMDVFYQYDGEYSINLTVECSNHATYQFESIEELFDCFDKKPYRIVELEIVVNFENADKSNKITLTFRNDCVQSIKAGYHFDNIDEYLLQKSKIEQCMKNYRLNYYFLAKMPILGMLATISFVAVCEYTWIKGIVFSTELQYGIIILWMVSLMASGLFYFYPLPLKKNLFPFVEFRIGQNEMIEQKNEKNRGFILGSCVFALVLGILVNAISNLLF